MTAIFFNDSWEKKRAMPKTEIAVRYAIFISLPRYYGA